MFRFVKYVREVFWKTIERTTRHVAGGWLLSRNSRCARVDDSARMVTTRHHNPFAYRKLSPSIGAVAMPPGHSCSLSPRRAGERGLGKERRDDVRQTL